MTDPNRPQERSYDDPANPAQAGEPVVSKPYVMPDDPEPGSVETLQKEAAEARDRVLRTLGASRWQRLRFAQAPAAIPGLITGAKLAVAVSAIAAVLAEQSGSSEGLGHLIAQAIPQLDTALAWAAVVVLSAFAILLFTALSVAERRLVPLSHRSRGARP